MGLARLAFELAIITNSFFVTFITQIFMFRTSSTAPRLIADL